MRIIAGKYRGRTLKSPPSLATRPTSDRLRETLFNILAPRIAGARFLDLCAGTGAVGIEALSRDAGHVILVDKSRKMSGVIEANAAALKISANECEIVSAEGGQYLKRRTRQSAESFDIIYFDPPYAADYDAVLNLIGEHAQELLAAGGVVVVEHHKKKELEEKFGALRRYRVVKQGDSVLSFYEAS